MILARGRPEVLAYCPRCGHQVGLREDGTFRAHRGKDEAIRGSVASPSTPKPPAAVFREPCAIHRCWHCQAVWVEAGRDLPGATG